MGRLKLVSAMFSLVVVAIGGLLIVTAPALAANKPLDESARQKAIDALFAQYNQPDSPGVVVGVYKGGRILYTRAYGLADLNHNVPITTRTVFNACSLSKQFTAFAIALLAREGKVNLDADIRTYLPFMPDFGKTIRVRDLVHHTSGLRSDMQRIAGHDFGDVLISQHSLNIAAHQKGLNFDPGSQMLYSNTAYDLLSEIVHVASGKTLRQFLDERVFRPLGMNNSFVFDNPGEVVPNLAESYILADGHWQHVPRAHGITGSTNLHTTIEDFAHWAGNFSHPTVGDAALIAQITSPGKLADGTPVNYAFGLWRGKFAGHAAIMHTGSEAGFRTIFAHFPDSDLSLAVFSNTPVDRYALADAIADIYLNDGDGKPRTVSVAAVTKRARLKAAAGHYVNELGQMLTLDFADGQLFWISPEIDGREPLVLRADGVLDVRSVRYPFSYHLVTDKKGRVTAIEGRLDSMDIKPSVYDRIEQAHPSAAALGEFVGEYRNDELDITYHLTVENGALVARSLWTARPFVLLPTITDGFSSALGGMKFQRGATGQPAGFLLSSDRARYMLFTRETQGL